MLKNFTKEYFLSHRGCYDRNKMANICATNKHETIQEFLNWDIPIKDKFYFVRNYTELTTKDKQFLSLMCAKVSLDIYEKKYTNDFTVRNCIQATEDFLNGNGDREELMKHRAAAYAAYAATAEASAYAAYAAAASAAADAAYAAYASAYAAYADAAYAASAADAAAYASAYAAYAAASDAAYAAYAASAASAADAAYAAYAADAAAADAADNSDFHKKNLLNALKQFCEEI